MAPPPPSVIREQVMRTKFLGWAAALFLLACFAVGFGVVSKRILTGLSGDAALGWLTFIATTWFAIWSFQKTKRKEAEAQIFPEKAKIYKEIIDIIRDITFAQKGWGPTVSEAELAKRFGRVRYDMIIWAGQDTVRALSAFEESSSGGDVGTMFAAAANLYANIRRELGHADDQELATDLFLTQLIAEDREKVRQMLKSQQGRQ